MAEREGFEPSIGVKAYTPLAGERLQPLGHLSRNSNNHNVTIVYSPCLQPTWKQSF